MADALKKKANRTESTQEEPNKKPSNSVNVYVNFGASEISREAAELAALTAST